MARHLPVKINETVSELEKRLSRLITVRGRELIQMIYWLKTNQVLTPLPWSAQNLNMDELERPKTMPLVSTKKS